MDNAHLEKLRLIKTFPSLVKYLREDLDWPIASDDFEELTFDYQPEELGLEPKIAVKIKEIKQLRPLVTNQPWGIFFINFEPKRLPVLVLRRVLRSLVLKKRTSANKPQQAAWNLHDLLFISSYGEENERAITFAHFKDEQDIKLPSLKVIGWDTQDTPLHMDQCSEELGKLRFDTALSPNQWREQWSSAFTLENREVITTSKELAERMASLATKIRKRVNAILKLESEKGPIRKLYKAVQQTLIHDLKEDDFADMYAQTVTYGLFSARCSRSLGIDAGDLSEMIPASNPFLKDLLSTFITIGGRKGKIDFDELGINDVVSILNAANMEAVKRDFDDKNPEHDPVIHFYEDFLKQYDAQKKVKRGVFYTPKPVVSFIVRSVHEILQKEFGLEDGLADTTTWGQMLRKHPEMKLPTISVKNPKTLKMEDVPISENEPFVQILDPAVGTGTFLVEVIDIIKKAMYKKWEKQGHLPLEFTKLWNEYVPKHLLPRLYGFELMMAPYAIAHMKISLKLYETEYKFGDDERARIYLTNSLEPPQDFSDRFEFDAPALAHEAKAVNTVKSHKRFTVVIGNPPYSYMTANLTKTSAALIEPFRFVDGVRIIERSALSLERSLQDDFIKFFGLALSLRQDTGPTFVLGFITNNSYMDSPLHRGVRGELVRLFNRLYLVNLFGDSIKDREENVFDIQQGVAIFLGEACDNGTNPCVCMSDIHGNRSEKYGALSQQSWKTSRFIEIQPSAPQRYFLHLKNDDEYLTLPSLTDIFQLTSTCIKTLKDDLATGFEACEVQDKIEYFCAPKTSKEDIKKRFGVEDVVQWKMEPARRVVRSVQLKDFLIQYQARPFDYRWMFYHNAVVGSPRTEVMRNLLRTPNRALIANRKVRTGECLHFWVTSRICVSEVISSADNSNCFPLYVLADEHGLKLGANLHTNFSPVFLKQLSSKLALPQTTDNGLPQGLTPEDIFNYIYAVFHSPTYRIRYAEFLKIDFPRVPLTSSLDLFRSLAKLGGELISLHLMESDKLNKHITKWLGQTPSSEIEKVIWSDDTVWINKSKTEGFKGVTENVWNFHIGGYQVCEKWLKDRKGRKLSKEDIEHYQKVVVALSETIRLMNSIDEVIDNHGGWPKAFTVNEG
jgi:predicted helicase